MREFLRNAWNAWKRMGRFIGDAIARIVLSLFYFTIFLPFGLGVRLFGGADSRKDSSEGFWEKRSSKDVDLVDASRLY